MPNESRPWPTTNDPSLQRVFDRVREAPDGLPASALEDDDCGVTWSTLDDLVKAGFLIELPAEKPDPAVDYMTYASRCDTRYVLGSPERVARIREIKDAQKAAVVAMREARAKEEGARVQLQHAKLNAMLAHQAWEDAEQAVRDAQEARDEH